MFEQMFFNSLTRTLLCIILILSICGVGFVIGVFFVTKRNKFLVLRLVNYISKVVLFLIMLIFIQFMKENKTFIDVNIFGYFLYFAFVPLSLSVSLFILRKVSIYLIDIISYILFLPCFIYLGKTSYSILIVIGVCIEFLRIVFTLIRGIEQNKNRYKFFLTKQSLDNIKEGLAIQGKKFNEFQNVAFQQFMDRLEINKYDSLENIWDSFKNNTKYNKAVYDQDTFVIKVENDYFLVRRHIEDKNYEIVVYCVNDEIKVKKIIEQNFNIEKAQNKALKEYVNNIKEIEKEGIILQTKSNYHNILGEKVSIIQCILNDYFTKEKFDMKSFKEKLIINLDEINKETISDFKTEFHNLIKTFEMAGFDIVLSKNIDKIDLLNCKEFLDIIRECATNSLRHAKATKLFINIKNGKKLIEIRIFDNKKIATQSLSESTGLFSIRENVKSVNGKTDIKFVDGFEIRIDLPDNPDQSLN